MDLLLLINEEMETQLGPAGKHMHKVMEKNMTTHSKGVEPDTRGPMRRG